MSWGNFLGSVVDGVADFGMGLFNYRANKKMAKTAYNRSLYMSNTAHQREVNDLIAAGLNPVLSAGGNGAATLSVSPGASPNMHRGSSYAQAVTQSRLVKSQSEANNANAALLNSKAQEQIAKNVITVAQSKYFEGLPEEAKYDLLNAMLYPNSNLGQARGLASGLIDAVGELGGKAVEKGKSFLDRWKDFTGDDAAQGGANSAKDVQRRKSDVEKGQKRAKEWLEFDKKFRKTGGFF